MWIVMGEEKRQSCKRLRTLPHRQKWIKHQGFPYSLKLWTISTSTVLRTSWASSYKNTTSYLREEVSEVSPKILSKTLKTVCTAVLTTIKISSFQRYHLWCWNHQVLWYRRLNAQKQSFFPNQERSSLRLFRLIMTIMGKILDRSLLQRQLW